MRPSLVRIGLVDSVTEALGGKIAQGEVGHALPGVRQLALELGVSVPTVCQALHRLREAGWLEGGNKRRWRIKTRQPAGSKPHEGTTTPRPQAVRSRAKRLLFISSQSLSTQRSSGVETFAHLLDILSVRNWEMVHKVLPFEPAKSAHQGWDNLLELTQPDALVVLDGNPVLGQWALDRGLRALFLGGSAGTTGVPILAVSISSSLVPTLEELLAKGHRRILLPLLARQAGFAVKIRKLAEDLADFKGGKSNCLVTVESAYQSPDVMVALLRREWRKTAPDALILFDFREFVAASAFLGEMKIQIPRDLSVVILSHSPAMDWHLPPLAHFEHPAKLLARKAAQWVLRRGTNLPPLTFIPARWVQGKSIQTRA